MGRRQGFHQILTNDPPAVDVVREDAIVEKLNVGECLFRWEKSPENFEIIKGIVLQSGLKKDLLVRHVNAAREVVATGGLITRKREIERLRMLQVNAKKITLQTAEQLLGEGADAVSELAQPVIKKKKVARYSSLTPLQTQRLKEELAKIGCFEEKTGKTRLCRDYNVFVSSGKLAIALLKYRIKPSSLHQAVLKLALPEKVLRLDGISRTGKKGCVGICSDITESITLYVSPVFKAAGGNIRKIDYDPDAKLKNLLYNTRRRKRKIRLIPTHVPSESVPSTSADMSSATTSTFDMSTASTSKTLSTSQMSPNQSIKSINHQRMSSATHSTPRMSSNNPLSTEEESSPTDFSLVDHNSYFASPKVYLLSEEVTLPYNNY